MGLKVRPAPGPSLVLLPACGDQVSDTPCQNVVAVWWMLDYTCVHHYVYSGCHCCSPMTQTVCLGGQPRRTKMMELPLLLNLDSYLVYSDMELQQESKNETSVFNLNKTNRKMNCNNRVSQKKQKTNKFALPKPCVLFLSTESILIYYQVVNVELYNTSFPNNIIKL